MTQKYTSVEKVGVAEATKMGCQMHGTTRMAIMLWRLSITRSSLFIKTAAKLTGIPDSVDVEWRFFANRTI